MTSFFLKKGRKERGKGVAGRQAGRVLPVSWEWWYSELKQRDQI